MNDKYKRDFGFISFKKILQIIILLTSFLLCPSSMVFGEPLYDISWLSLETKYTIIRYQSFEDLQKFNRKIDYSPEVFGFMRIFSRTTSGNLPGEITKKVDAIYERVQDILDIRKQTKKTFIKIYPNKNLLLAAYKKIYGKSFSTYDTFAEPRGWYLYELNTIYINVNDLREGMLAHEMAHSIIDHYLSVRPPNATAEILARYVDSHLYSD